MSRGLAGRVMAVDPQQIVSKAVKSLHDNNKLLLVLDIDHTLVHCTKDCRAEIVLSDPSMKTETSKMYFEETGDKPYYLKLRPFIKPFLETLSQFFHLAVYTMGGKTYAKKVMKIIDPDNKILKKRLVCRDDHDDNVKVLQRMFPCDEKMVLVVDDRDDVWSTPQNVLKIWKFEFWPSDANDDDANMAPQEAKGRQTPDADWTIDKLRQRNHDNILGTTANVLQAIHRIYYHNESLYRAGNVCAYTIYAQLQKRVFSGVHIVFSGVFPNNERPEDTQEWKLAVQYGATCHLELNKRVTHVVAARAGTAKVHKARQMDVYVVHINWLRQSVIHFIRMFEPDFPIGSRVKPTTVSAHCSQPIDIMELSDFKLDSKRKKPKIFRPSELYLSVLDPNSPDFDQEKYKKYKYFVQQRERLLKSQLGAAPPQPPMTGIIQKTQPPPQMAHPPVPHNAMPQPPLQPPMQQIPQPQSGPFRYPPPNTAYQVPQGVGPILNSRLPPTGTGPLISTPAMPPVGLPPTQPHRRAIRRPRPMNGLGAPLPRPNTNAVPPLPRPNTNAVPPLPRPNTNAVQPLPRPNAPPPRPNNNARPPPQRFPSMNAPVPLAQSFSQASRAEIDSVKARIVSFLQGKYWTPLEVIYVHLREHFDVPFLKKVGMENETFYQRFDEFKLQRAERRWIVRLSDAFAKGPQKRTSNDAGLLNAAPTKRKKTDDPRDNRHPSPVPDFSVTNRQERRQEKARRDTTYTHIKAKKKKKNGWVVPDTERRKLRGKKYGPLGQERNIHPLDPRDSRSHQPCKFYMEGNCLKQKCPYLHEQLQLHMRPPNDEWTPLNEKDFPLETASPKKKKKQNRNRKLSKVSSDYDQHDHRRALSALSDGDSDFYSPDKRGDDDDDDFSSLLKQHLGGDYAEDSVTPRKKQPVNNKRKRDSPQVAVPKQSKKKNSNEPEELFDENLRIVGTVEKDDEEEEGECSDTSDEEEQVEDNMS